MSGGLKIAFTCPRYRAGSAGGAETLTREWAERLARRGHHCQVLTSRSRSNLSWENELPGGQEEMDGVLVRRFDLEYSPPLPGKPQPVGRLLETPSSPALQAFIRENLENFDRFVFAPYLFGLTAPGIAATGKKSVLVPCLHDEPGAYLPGVKTMFATAGRILFNSAPEEKLARALTAFPPENAAVVGLGIEPPEKISGEDFRRKFGLPRPFLLYAGRREPGKGIPLLVEYFRALIRHRDPGLDLVLAGSGEVELSEADRGRIRDLGFLEEADKWNAYAAANVFCQPSTHESFSIVLLEAFAAGTPALVSARCEVTREHCRLSGGGLWFSDYPEFEEALWHLRENPPTARALGAAGKAYVERQYRWENILPRLERALTGEPEKEKRDER